MLRTKFIAIYAGLALAISFCLPASEPQSSRLQAADAPSPSPGSASAASYRLFFDNHCVTCHDETGEAGLNLDSIDLAKVSEDAELWEKVVHKLRTGDMPPPDEPQPPTKARRALLSWLVTSLDKAAAADPNPGRPAIHRLNRADTSAWTTR